MKVADELQFCEDQLFLRLYFFPAGGVTSIIHTLNPHEYTLDSAASEKPHL